MFVENKRNIKPFCEGWEEENSIRQYGLRVFEYINVKVLKFCTITYCARFFFMTRLLQVKHGSL